MTLPTNYDNINTNNKGGICIEVLARIICISFIGYALGSDLRSFKVKNIVFILGWLVALVLTVGIYGWIGVLKWSFRSVMPVICLLPIYMIRCIGGADVKAFSLISAFLGCNLCLTTILLSFIFAGVFSVLIYIFSGALFQLLHSLAEEIKNCIVYGIRIDLSRIVIKYHRIHFMLPIWLALVIILLVV